MLKPKQVLEIINERLGCSIQLRTIYNWIKTGKLPSKKLGGMVLIARSDLDIFLADFNLTDQKEEPRNEKRRH